MYALMTIKPNNAKHGALARLGKNDFCFVLFFINFNTRQY